MASINSLMSTSSTSSIYGNSNIISGLASGMDTEAMIENAVSGIKNKLAGFTQDKTVLEWEQEAYRSIIDKMVNFSNKYMSFSSNTNLLSSAFFDSAMKVTTSGKNADLISAIGAPTSNVRITKVSKLAQAATFTPTTEIAGGGGLNGTVLNLNADVYSSAITGSMTLNYGGKEYKLEFGEGDVYKSKSALVNGINKKLKELGLDGDITVSKSSSGTGIIFDAAEDTALTVTQASGDLAKELKIGKEGGIQLNEDIKDKLFIVNTSDLYNTQTLAQSLIGKEFSFTLDGVTKKITLSQEDMRQDGSVADLADVLQGKLNTAFGDGKVTVSEDSDKLSFAVNAGSTLSIEGAEALGLSANASNGVDTTKKLSDLNFAAGADGYKFTMNGKTLTFGADATLKDVIDTVNKDSDIGVKISYSKMTGKFQLTSRETGTAGKIEIKAGDLAEKLFGTADKTGTDAELDMEINGEELTGVTRSSNSFEVDGMTVTLNGTFTEGEAVGFTAKADTDKIVGAIKSMVEEFNTMANEIKDAYTTKPLTQTNGKKYKPLTEEDSKDMSDDAVKKYEEKAKTGLLFADSNLSSLYSELRNAISDFDLESIGIKTAYANGKTTMVLDEDKLRTSLEANPDKVRETLTREPDPADKKDQGGLMYRLQQATDKYAKTTGEKKGVLIELAGSEKAPASLNSNSYKSRMDRMQEQIERWQDKLSDKVDYYTRQFTALEKLISQMNSQSSSLAGMMGY